MKKRKKERKIDRRTEEERKRERATFCPPQIGRYRGSNF